MLSFLLFLTIYQLIFCSSCTEGKNFCERCNPLTKLCAKCSYDVLTPDENGGCQGHKKCSDGSHYCAECEEDGYICKTCEDGFLPDKNGGCTYTFNCEVSYEGICIKCLDNYILIGDNTYDFYGDLRICKSNSSEEFKNCEIINTEKGVCKSCKEGYYLTEKDKKCISIKNCAESSYGLCKKCSSGYYLDKLENLCLKQEGVFKNCKITLDSEKCDTCNDDYYLDQNGVCIWSNFCLREIDYKCIKCIDNYYLTQNSECTPEEHCIIGKRHLGICTLCQDNYYIDYKDGKCKPNTKDNDFKYCKIADGECNTCIDGYFLSEDNKCTLTTNCAEVYNGKCLSCKDDYHLGIDKICTNVEHCVYSYKNSECIECEDDYYYDPSDRRCKLAENKLLNCKTAIEGSSCDACKDDFYLNKTDHLCYSNLEDGNFLKCAYTDSEGERCSSCIEGYYLGEEDYKCSSVDGCLVTENENRCAKCDSKLYCLNLKTGKCEINYEIEKEEQKFYYMCNETNEEGTGCQQCLDGYILSERGLCVDDLHCVEKEDGVCKRCSNENYEYYCLNDYFGCIDSIYENCLECSEILDLHRCTKCYEGYELNKHNICIEKKE